MPESVVRASASEGACYRIKIMTNHFGTLHKPF